MFLTHDFGKRDIDPFEESPFLTVTTTIATRTGQATRAPGEGDGYPRDHSEAGRGRGEFIERGRGRGRGESVNDPGRNGGSLAVSRKPEAPAHTPHQRGRHPDEYGNGACCTRDSQWREQWRRGGVIR